MVCHGCGGVVGRDCFNPQECEQITRQMAEEHQRQNQFVQPERSSAIDLIVAERERQITQEGWSVSHDDQHEDSELAEAASCYALPPTIGVRAEHWPWDWSWWKPTEKDRIRELVKAGALIIAEIERLKRLQD
mgnify:CR=1 FL=1